MSVINRSGLTVTLPRESIPLTIFCTAVDLAHRNSPLARSKLQTIEVLQGIPVRVLRLEEAARRPMAIMPSALGSGLTFVVIGIISKVHSWSQLSCGRTWCFQMIFPVLGCTA
jgi:hypothetical protein